MSPDLPIITPSAAKRIALLLAKEPVPAFFRVSVKGGGCSGFQYIFDIVSQGAPDDIKLEQSGLTVLLDAMSLEFLKNAQIDFVDSLMGQFFQVNNPNATASCGCGTSFAI